MRWVDHLAHVNALGGHWQPPGLETVIGHILPWRGARAFALSDDGGPVLLLPSDPAYVAHLPLPNSDGCMPKGLDSSIKTGHLGFGRLLFNFLGLNQKVL